MIAIRGTCKRKKYISHFVGLVHGVAGQQPNIDPGNNLVWAVGAHGGVGDWWVGGGSANNGRWRRPMAEEESKVFFLFPPTAPPPP